MEPTGPEQGVITTESQSKSPRDVMREQLHNQLADPRNESNYSIMLDDIKEGKWSEYNAGRAKMDELLDKIPDHMLSLFYDTKQNEKGEDEIMAETVLFTRLSDLWDVQDSDEGTQIAIKGLVAHGDSTTDPALEKLKGKIEARPESWTLIERDEKAGTASYLYKKGQAQATTA